MICWKAGCCCKWYSQTFCLWLHTKLQMQTSACSKPCLSMDDSNVSKCCVQAVHVYTQNICLPACLYVCMGLGMYISNFCSQSSNDHIYRAPGIAPVAHSLSTAHLRSLGSHHGPPYPSFPHFPLEINMTIKRGPKRIGEKHRETWFFSAMAWLSIAWKSHGSRKSASG